MRECTKILIVDDELNIRSLLARELSDDSTECVVTHSPFEALNKTRNEGFSILISDIMMPGMSGMELLRLVRKHDSVIGVIMITGMGDVKTAVDSLRMGASDFITKPFDLPTMQRAIHRALERRRLIIENRFYRQELEKNIRKRTTELNGALEEIEESYTITLEALVSALDAREHETHAHSQRVKEFALALARQLGLEGDELTHMGRGALLHDVGKIGVPDSILLKPGKLTHAEWVEMRRHPQTGYEILRNIKFLSPAAEIVLCHQERWDGKGYPNSLRGGDIPLGARIFAVVDALDAMTSDRPYREALSFETALAEIKNCAGSQFDSQIVDCFFSIPHQVWFDIYYASNQACQNGEHSDLLCRA
jgi:putative nucleotidyltransferase with HDIG domain